MIADDLTCRELVELLTDYHEGALTVDERDRFEQHLVICEGCRAYLDQIATTIRVTGRLREEELPAGAREAILRAFRGWRRERGRL